MSPNRGKGRVPSRRTARRFFGALFLLQDLCHLQEMGMGGQVFDRQQAQQLASSGMGEGKRLHPK